MTDQQHRDYEIAFNAGHVAGYSAGFSDGEINGAVNKYEEGYQRGLAKGRDDSLITHPIEIALDENGEISVYDILYYTIDAILKVDKAKKIGYSEIIDSLESIATYYIKKEYVTKNKPTPHTNE